jgi:FkbM family methyltransferase
MQLYKIQNYFYPYRILDIGANIGQFHLLCKQYFPTSYVFSIEASNECDSYLKQIKDQYYIGLLAKDESYYEFYSFKNNPVNTDNSIYKELTEYYSDSNLDIINKKGIKLDNLFNSESKFDLIKIDTQGSELDIISGGIQLCSKVKGILLEVSLTQYNENAPLYDDVIAFMDKFGFKVAEILNEHIHPTVHQQDILFIKNNENSFILRS